VDEKPSEHRGGTTPDEEESREKGEWAAKADEGIVPAEGAEQGESEVLGRTTGSDEPATEEGIDESAGDEADAVTDGGPKAPEDDEPDLKDVGGA
jgi:hypothetical protein